LKAWLNLRLSLPERIAIFTEGLQRIGFKVQLGLPAEPRDGDVLVTWNRIGHGDLVAKQFEARGLTVLVAENAAWGNGFSGDRWLSMARRYHNTAGMFPVGDASRWDSLGAELKDWRPPGGEIVGLPQRGIGPPGVAMPRGWQPIGCSRIRQHPGTRASISLEEDLARTSWVKTWGSGAAVMALMWGIRVESEYPEWIARQNNTTEGRLAMFRALAWAQWRLSEIQCGEAFHRLLS